MARYTKELLAPIIAKNDTWAGVCRELGVKPFTGAQSHIRQRAEQFGIDSSHFVGHGWAAGKTFEKKPLETYLVKDSNGKSHKIRQRLISEGYKEAQCEICLRTEWNNEPIPLELDHINSDHFDNRLENLQIICPNCHALETSKRKRASVVE